MRQDERRSGGTALEVVYEAHHRQAKIERDSARRHNLRQSRGRCAELDGRHAGGICAAARVRLPPVSAVDGGLLRCAECGGCSCRLPQDVRRIDCGALLRNLRPALPRRGIVVHGADRRRHVHDRGFRVLEEIRVDSGRGVLGLPEIRRVRCEGYVERRASLWKEDRERGGDD